LAIKLAGCDGEADAFYDENVITICYEYVDELWHNMPKKTAIPGFAPFDTVVGPFVDTSLHEFAHSLIDVFNLPVLGREEDAADQIAAYTYLQLGPVEARRLVMGTAYAYLSEAKRERSPSSKKFSDEHGTPEQRAYNLMCIAYGADTKLFGDLVSKGYLPKERADQCEEEYEQIQDAVEILIQPHVDQALAKKIINSSWLRKSPKGRPRHLGPTPR
jgi:Putative metallopeptidase